MAGRKKRRRREKGGEPAIPVDSFSDIAFLLIIFFILTTVLNRTQGILTEMPAGSKDAQAQSEKTPIINLQGNTIRFNDTSVDMEGLSAKLVGMDLKNQPDEKKIIMLETADGVPYERYFQVMSTISNSGGVVALVRGDEE